MKFPSHKITGIRSDGTESRWSVGIIWKLAATKQRKTITKNNNFNNSDGDDDDSDDNNVETFNLPLLRTQLFQSDKNASTARWTSKKISFKINVVNASSNQETIGIRTRVSLLSPLFHSVQFHFPMFPSFAMRARE